MHLRLSRAPLHAGHYALLSLFLHMIASSMRVFFLLFLFLRDDGRDCDSVLRAPGKSSVGAFLSRPLFIPIPHAYHVYVHSKHSFPQDDSNPIPGLFFSSFFLFFFVSSALLRLQQFYLRSKLLHLPKGES
ncbi:hypothetical protein CSUI_008566 [Cystoisospora suis]|uniref:Transmembrane protein n=1 Tax=Cystoisospora suis TaxID=483139 RepID=A0A2C6KMC6_9APIC|nr:hypothetical protein CSUI_008566 [Cystoisospora suis]